VLSVRFGDSPSGRIGAGYRRNSKRVVDPALHVVGDVVTEQSHLPCDFQRCVNDRMNRMISEYVKAHPRDQASGSDTGHAALIAWLREHGAATADYR